MLAQVCDFGPKCGAYVHLESLRYESRHSGHGLLLYTRYATFRLGLIIGFESSSVGGYLLPGCFLPGLCSFKLSHVFQILILVMTAAA